jgi:hypothetical protein
MWFSRRQHCDVCESLGRRNQRELEYGRDLGDCPKCHRGNVIDGWCHLCGGTPLGGWIERGLCPGQDPTLWQPADKMAGGRPQRATDSGGKDPPATHSQHTPPSKGVSLGCSQESRLNRSRQEDHCEPLST